MPRVSLCPILYDVVDTLRVSDLKNVNALEQGFNKKGVVTWFKGTDYEYKINLKVNISLNDPYIQLNYHFRGVLRGYIVKLTSIPSNLGIGRVWYFVCPKTGLRCRKLYLIDGYFLHRKAFSNCLYQLQIYSKMDRFLIRRLSNEYAIDRAFEQIDRRYFKKYYKGKKTRKYERFVKILKRS